MKFAVFTVAVSVSAACRAPAPEMASTPDPAALRFDITAIDRAADPCSDFYAFACGGWVAKHPIPADRTRWSRYTEVEVQNLAHERAIVEGAAHEPGPAAAHIAAYHAACIDATAIEARGLAPLAEIRAQIDALTPANAATTLAAIDRAYGPLVLSVSTGPDRDDARRQVLDLEPGDVGLGDPDDYTRTGADAEQVRVAYRGHVERVLRALADPDPAGDAAALLAFETRLSAALPQAAQRRDSNAQPGPIAVEALAAGFDWRAYFAQLGVPASALGRIDVPFPTWTAAFAAALQDPTGLRAYLRYHTARAMSAVLPRAIDEEFFAFTGKTLRGAREQPPRWRRCLSLLDRDLGDEVGRQFVARYFPLQTRDRVRQLVDRIVKAFDAELGANTWLGPVARTAARKKLAAMKVQIGYPVHWKQYDFAVRADDPVGNAARAQAASMTRELAKLGQPSDRDEFFGLAQELDGFGTPPLVTVGFTAGFLQPPIFDPSIDDAINFGGFGGVIGHEITHHFDDEGRKYDADGNHVTWWSDAEVAAYQQRAQCFVDEYSRFHLADGTPVDGRLTLGENIADNSGLRLSWEALSPRLDGAREGGFTQAQRFFLAWGQIRCENITPEAARRQVQRDPHSPGRFRVNGVVSNLPEFARAFSCPAGAPMAPAERCRIW